MFDRIQAQPVAFGLLDQPTASLNSLGATAVNAQADVSGQAIDQRFSQRSADFMQALLKEALLRIATHLS